jgi:hypothetical protein
MAETLTADERAELLPFIEEKIDELLATTAGADAETVERAVSHLLLGAARASSVPAEVADAFMDVLEARGGDAAACLQAVAALGPWPMAERARDALARPACAARAGVPEGIGALRVTEALSVSPERATGYLLRLERPGEPAWQEASVSRDVRAPGGDGAVAPRPLAG